jgi:hypothetical protein
MLMYRNNFYAFQMTIDDQTKIDFQIVLKHSYYLFDLRCISHRDEIVEVLDY